MVNLIGPLPPAVIYVYGSEMEHSLYPRLQVYEFKDDVPLYGVIIVAVFQKGRHYFTFFFSFSDVRSSISLLTSLPCSATCQGSSISLICNHPVLWGKGVEINMDEMCILHVAK